MTDPHDENLFKAPAARVHDYTPPEQGTFLPGGRRVPAGHGLNWLGGGWSLFRRAPGVWIGITVAFVVIVILLGFVPIANLLASVLAPVFVGGILIGCRALHDGDDLNFGHLFAGFTGGHLGNLVLVGVIYLAGVMLIGLTVGILSALLIGGAGLSAIGQLSMAALPPLLLLMLVAAAMTVPLAMAVWYAPALVVFHQVGAFEAMTTSFGVALRNFMPFFVYGLAFLVLAVLATLPFGLGWLVLTPVTFATVYVSYRDMFIAE